MDVIINSPIPLVDPGDLIERLNAGKVSPLVCEYSRQLASRGGQTFKRWGDADFAQVRRDIATYPLYEYACIALGARVTPAMRGRISEQDAAPFRPALDWLALARLVQSGIRLGRCDCGKFFADTKRRGKTSCSATCGSRLRARRRYEDLKTKPRKLRAYRKNQAALMRKRRKAGLA